MIQMGKPLVSVNLGNEMQTRRRLQLTCREL